MSLVKDQIFYGDVQVRHDSQGFISLNDMWVAAGCPEGKRDPRRWKDEAGKEFIEFIANKLNVRIADIYKSQRGKHGGGSWAHWQIALSYAKYLSPEFHAWANQVIKERVEEDTDPELGIKRSHDRAIKNFRKKGMDDEHIEVRLKSIYVRNSFTKTLQSRNVKGFGYVNCTNNIYIPILGGEAKNIREQKGLKKNANIRDNISMVELGSVMFAEILASDKIKREGRQGNNQCAIACLKSGMSVKDLVDKHEQSISFNEKQHITTDQRSENNYLADRVRLMEEKSKNGN